MVSTVAVAPGLAMLRVGKLHNIPYFPRYTGEHALKGLLRQFLRTVFAPYVHL